MEQLSLFNLDEQQIYVVGSNEWRAQKYYELINYSFEQLIELDHQINERYYIKNKWFNDEDYYTGLVIIDIFHSYYIEQFKKRYPKACVYYVVPKYL